MFFLILNQFFNVNSNANQNTYLNLMCCVHMPRKLYVIFVIFFLLFFIACSQTIDFLSFCLFCLKTKHVLKKTNITFNVISVSPYKFGSACKL